MEYIRKLGNLTHSFTFPYTIGDLIDTKNVDVGFENDFDIEWKLYIGTDKV